MPLPSTFDSVGRTVVRMTCSRGYVKRLTRLTLHFEEESLRPRRAHRGRGSLAPRRRQDTQPRRGRLAGARQLLEGAVVIVIARLAIARLEPAGGRHYR